MHTYTKLRYTNGIPVGSIKHHKPNYPLRPIVSYIGSSLYNTSFLSEILSPIQNSNGRSFIYSTDFKNKIIDISTDDDEIMLSFEVDSPFTSIPVGKVCERIRTKLNLTKTCSTERNLLLMTLYNYCVSHFLIAILRTYKQTHGCAIGSPLSAPLWLIFLWKKSKKKL